MHATPVVHAALFLPARAQRALPALVEHCEANGYRVGGIAANVRDTARLVASGAVGVVVAITWRRDLDRAVTAAGGRLETLRPRPNVVPTLPDLVAALVAAGRLGDDEARQLLAAAPPTEDGPAPDNHPRRIS